MPPSTHVLTKTLSLLAVALPGFTPGCTTKPQGPGGFHPATSEAVAALRDLDLKLVKLTAGGSEVAIGDAAITLRFGDAGKVAGRSAVNRYFGGYELGPEGAIAWPSAGFGSTRMAGPEAAMRLEAQFFQAFRGTSRLLTSPARVRFQSLDVAEVLEFTK